MEPQEISDDNSVSKPKYNYKTIISMLSVLALALGVIFGVAQTGLKKTLDNRASGISITPAPSSVFGKAVKLDSNNENNLGNMITIPSSSVPITAPLTIEGWINPDLPNSETPAPIFSAPNNSLYPYCTTYSIDVLPQSLPPVNPPNSYIVGVTYNTTNGNYGGPVQNDYLISNTWAHVALTLAQANGITTAKLYINGKLADSRDLQGTLCPIKESLFIGGQDYRTNQYPNYYKGLIDEVRLSRIVRYKTDFALQYKPFVTDAYTLALWHFDGDLNDNANAKFNGTASTPVTYEDSTVPITNINPAVVYFTSPNALPGAKKGQAYNASIVIRDPNVADIPSVTFEGVPPELTIACKNPKNINQTVCTITGTPQVAGEKTIVFKMTDSRGGVNTKSYMLVVADGVVGPTITTGPTITKAPTATRTPTNPPTPTLGAAKRVFISSQSYTGNLGGLSGADAKCTSLATTAGLGGSWRAWLSSNTVSASSRLNHHTGPYNLVNGTIIANNWTGIMDKTSTGSINITESGGSKSANVWTNTTATGGIASPSTSANYGGHCADWASTTSSLFGVLGFSGSTFQTNGWTWSTSQSCANQAALYCFEQ